MKNYPTIDDYQAPNEYDMTNKQIMNNLEVYQRKYHAIEEQLDGPALSPEMREFLERRLAYYEEIILDLNEMIMDSNINRAIH